MASPLILRSILLYFKRIILFCFSELESGESPYNDVFAQFCDLFRNKIFNCLLLVGIFDEYLIEKTVVAVKFFELAFDDLFDDLRRFA